MYPWMVHAPFFIDSMHDNFEFYASNCRCSSLLGLNAYQLIFVMPIPLAVDFIAGHVTFAEEELWNHTSEGF